MRFGISILCLTTVAACAMSPGYMWWKDGVAQEQMTRDQTQCEYEAKANTPPVYVGGLPALVTASGREVDLYILCLKARGYYRIDLASGKRLAGD